MNPFFVHKPGQLGIKLKSLLSKQIKSNSKLNEIQNKIQQMRRLMEFDRQ